MARSKAIKKEKPGSSRSEAETKRNLFVEAFLANGGNASQAAITAGYSAKTAPTCGAKLLKHPHVVQVLTQRRATIQEKHALSTDEIMADLARALRFDPRKLYNQDGTMKPIHELDDDTALCLTGIEVVTMAGPPGEDGEEGAATPLFVKKIKWESKAQARDQALKVFGMFEKDNKQKAGMLNGLPRELIKAMIERLQALNGEYRRIN
ncbi:terminase small subunit [Dechloromonas agitata]|uniref:terminase small subunit n=1 Tax=Dechloromonas agitata TaxID=73030 RepID=UPI00237ED636|nr:terminase small subunit [Dechloromonas agitata]MDE1545940.1 terminase small subunit [Dechloromonas agitata]